MNIQEAIREAIRKDACIIRERYRHAMKIKPTRTQENFIVFHKNGKGYGLWSPTVDDLLSDDWDITN